MTEPTCKIDANGSKKWYLNGFLHREDGPAVEFPNGSKEWYLNGVLHREDGPAVEVRGSRANLLALVLPYKRWYLNGKLHREDGPAIMRSGTRYWYLHGKLIAVGPKPKNWEELVLLTRVEQVMND